MDVAKEKVDDEMTLEIAEEEVDDEMILERVEEEEEVNELVEIAEENVDDEITLEIVDSIGEKLKASSQKKMNSNDFTISRVPAALRRGKEVYYEPTIVSIGPYHHGKEKYEAMEEHKWGQLQDFLNHKPNISINTYVTELRKLETDARRCYFEDIKLSSKEFVEMMLLDGCFILEFFFKYFNDDASVNAPISSNSNIRFQVCIDLLLLENQIPFFILQCLIDIFAIEKQDSLVLFTLIAACFHQFYEIPGSDNGVMYYVDECWKREQVYDHLLHIFHSLHHPTSEPAELTQPNIVEKYLSRLLKLLPEWHSNPTKLVSLCFRYLQRKQVEEVKWRSSVPCATNLSEAGITFKKKEKYSFATITFNDGTLEIPCIYIDDPRKSLMMNLIAFEQCNLPKKNRIVSFYSVFMDHIIDTAKDVEILQQSNILESYLNSDDETANFFNQLNDHVIIIPEESYLLPVIEKINKYCETSRHKWRAKLMRDYFGNPWAIISLVAAIILLILTSIQTFFAMYSYFKPR